MKRSWKARMMSAVVASVVLGAAFLCGHGSALAEDEDEEEIAVEDLPEAVVNAVRKRFPNATIEEAERETEHGQVIYDVEVEDSDGAEYELEVTADGRILEIERDDDDDDEDDEDDD